MSVEGYLMSVVEKQEHIGKLLRLQSALRDQAADCAVADPVVSSLRLAQARRMGRDILAAYEALEKRTERVRRFIEKLPREEERQVLKLCYLSGLHTRAVGEILGYSERHVYRIRHRGLMHLEGFRL